MEPHAAAEIAKRGALRLAAALEDPKESDSQKLSNLGDALAALANKMEPHAAAEIAKRGALRLAAALEDPKESDSGRLSNLGDALAALTNKMEPHAAAEIAKRGAARLAGTLENSQAIDYSRTSHSFEILTKIMETRAVVEIARGLLAALEDPKESDSDRLLSLSNTLATLANRMEPQAAAEIAKRGALRLAAALEDPKESDSDRLSNLGNALAMFCKLLPSAHNTALLAISNGLLWPTGVESIDDDRPTHRELLAEVCAQLPVEHLMEVLKYPFCAGEADHIVLKALETRTGRKFDGAMWKFIEEADSLGVKDIDDPAKRPKGQDALKELDAL
jgi:hypothetical protein